MVALPQQWGNAIKSRTQCMMSLKEKSYYTSHNIVVVDLFVFSLIETGLKHKLDYDISFPKVKYSDNSYLVATYTAGLNGIKGLFS